MSTITTNIMDGVVLAGNSQGTLSVSGTAAHTSALTPGRYDLWCPVDVYIKIAATANDVTTSTGYLLRANNTLANVIIPNTPSGMRLGGITAGSASTLSYHKVN